MALNTENYLQQLQGLLPKGKAWVRDTDAKLTQFLRGVAEEFARIDARIEDLLNEADPRTTTELLLDWERVAGLPDTCVTAEQLLEQRRVALVSKLTMRGGQSRQYFIDIAASMGYADATIDEFRPMNCNDNCNHALHSEADRFSWRINLPNEGATYPMSCNDPCDSPLRAWGDKSLECRIERYKPAHTNVIFGYELLSDFNNDFNADFVREN